MDQPVPLLRFLTLLAVLSLLWVAACAVPFRRQVFFTLDAALGMGEGLPEYATIVIDEAENRESGRRERVARYLREYDEARGHCAEKPLGITMLTDAVEERRIALAKAALFYVALEDACGAPQMRAGLARVVALLCGQRASYDAVRASLEESNGKNLAEIFRVWLNERDVPQDFRNHYQSQPGGAQK